MKALSVVSSPDRVRYSESHETFHEEKSVRLVSIHLVQVVFFRAETPIPRHWKNLARRKIKFSHKSLTVQTLF